MPKTKGSKTSKVKPNLADTVTSRVQKCAYYMIVAVHETNAAKFDMKLSSVTHEGKDIGDWQVVITPLKKK